LKVLIVHRHLGFYGGAETVVIRLATLLKKKGIENSIIALSSPPPHVKETEDLDIITPEKEFTHKLRAITLSDCLESLNEIKTLRKLVHRNMERFDVINLHNFPANWSLFPDHKPSVWLLNEPIGLWHNVNPSLSAKVLNTVALKLDRFVVNSSIDVICVADKLNASRCQALYGRQPEIFPYGIEYELFSKGDCENAFEKFDLEGSFVLIHVGQITPSKNQLASVKAVDKLKDLIPNIKLVLAGVGDPPYMSVLKEYILERKIDKYIIFAGHIPKQMLSDLYHASDVAVFPIGSQGGFLSPFEALSACKPIVVSTRIGIADIIRREEIGIVTENLTDSVLEIYNDPKPYVHMAEKGKQYVAKNLNYETFCNRMLAVFERVLNQAAL
jgi:glycosyltransferase involved in cell wall biosynthesis